MQKDILAIFKLQSLELKLESLEVSDAEFCFRTLDESLDHPYVFELAMLVREDILDREIALTKLHEPENPKTLKAGIKKLGLSCF